MMLPIVEPMARIYRVAREIKARAELVLDK